jgi:hypothetical protein
MVVRKPAHVAEWAAAAAEGQHAAMSPSAHHGTRNAREQPAPARQARPSGETRTAPSAAERNAALREAYRARIGAMRASRAGCARRQARTADTAATAQPDVVAPHDADAAAAAAATTATTATTPAPPDGALRLSRAQRRRLARAARSGDAIQGALSRAGIADPVMRVALGEAIHGDGDINLARMMQVLAARDAAPTPP